MPKGEIWIEDTSANIVNDDEKVEAIDMLTKANPEICQHFKSVVFSIEGTTSAYYQVTYTDESKTEKIKATDLQIKQVTEYSQSPEIEKTYVADGKITINLKKEIAAGSKIGIIQNIGQSEENNFCSDDGTCSTGKCKFVKTLIKEWVTVNEPTKT